MSRIRRLLVAVSLATGLATGLAGPAIGAVTLPCAATPAYFEHIVNTPAADGRVQPCTV